MSSPDFFVSHYNFSEDARRNLKLPKRVKFHDITLRDGEQQAGIIFRKNEKIAIASALDEAGVDRIEAGMPTVSADDFETVRSIAHLGLSAEIVAFARCMKKDVDESLRCDVPALMMEVPSSNHLIKLGYGWTEQKAIDTAVEATDYAHKHGLKVTFFTIDSTRATFPVFWRLVDTVAKGGHMDALALVDTFGVANPEGIRTFVRRVKRKLKKPLEIHVHNDFGLAVANTVAAVCEGVDCVHTTINGIGERSGNASTEEVALALKLLYGVESEVNFSKLKKLSELVQTHSRIFLPPQKPIVGSNLFTTESGIIAGWWYRLEKINTPLEMFPFRPDYVGHSGDVRIVLGKKSGRDSILYKAEKLGLPSIPEDKLDGLLSAIKNKSEKDKRLVSDDEFVLMVRDLVGDTKKQR